MITPERTLTYRKSTTAPTRSGHWLRGRGAQPNTLVAVVMEKGWEQVVAVLGILLAGAAYLPIDPDLPSRAPALSAAQARSTLALTQAALLDGWPGRRASNALCVDTQVAWKPYRHCWTACKRRRTWPT